MRIKLGYEHIKRLTESDVPDNKMLENFVFWRFAVPFRLFKDFLGILFVFFSIKLDTIVNLKGLPASTM